ncbi:MAG TPA: glycosyltransferase family 39 protein, partial [Thermoanaerobaculia bacterium]|nr:glycosyltransferase family 39 protein [Thermoanaerobaculia bacterium]
MNERRAARASLAAAVIAGLGLRLWNLRGQVMGGDELHAVRVAARRTVPEILATYRLTDVSIPLTALARWLMEQGLTLSELDFRLPALLCGIAALLVIPRAFLGKMERMEVELLGWLVAFSPALVLYSRIARSYMPMVLAGFGAVMTFDRWWRTRSWKAGVAYVVLAGLAVWLHLGAAPLVVAPFLFALGDLVPPRREGRAKGLLALVGLGAGLAAALALILVPARRSLAVLVAAKRQEQTVPLASVLDALHLQAGTESDLLAALFWTAALAGAILLLRDRPRLG